VQRKGTLLVEYKQLRKANAFVDRRFGGEGPPQLFLSPTLAWQQLASVKQLANSLKHLIQLTTRVLASTVAEDDEELTTEERALIRFQKQRLKEAAGSKFALADEGDEELLTHLGRSLSDYGSVPALQVGSCYVR
jgi:nucleolar protein 14